MAYSDNPCIPGISYREDKAQELLEELGIAGDEERNYASLAHDEKRRLVSALARILINSGQLKKAEDLIWENFVFPKRPVNETYEANEFSTLLNACGRHGRHDTGIKVCLNNEEACAEARELLLHHRKMIRSGIEYASGHVQDLGKYYFVDGRGIVDESIIGIVCGMAIRQNWKKPIIGIAYGDGGTIKISGRGTRDLVKKGLNLADVMKKAAGEQGIGGGHGIAAGASIPKETLNDFLLSAGKTISAASEFPAEETDEK